VSRSPEDAARAARTEAEIKGKAFQDVEEAALAASLGSGGRMTTKVYLYFSQNSDSLPDEQLSELDKIAKTFEKDAQFTIMIHGFASEDEANKTSLSVKRAKAVKDYLVQIKSIPGQKIFVKGLGDKEPAASNDTEAGRSKNRRVRVQIITAGN
jgi:outer membrane protein OmpA-like peptidoglycan-associated protein